MILTIIGAAVTFFLVLWAFRALDRLTPYAGEPTEQEMDDLAVALEAELEFETLDDLARIEAGRKLYEQAALNRKD